MKCEIQDFMLIIVSYYQTKIPEVVYVFKKYIFQFNLGPVIMALADSRTHLEESENGTLYGTRTERVAVQGADGEWIAGIRKIEMALITLPNGAARIITRTQEAVGIVSNLSIHLIIRQTHQFILSIKCI